MSPRSRSLVSLGLGVVLIAALFVGMAAGRASFFQAYLVGFGFWTGLSIGAMSLLMMHHLTGGKWGYLARRPLEAAVTTFPLLGLLFIPIWFGLPHLYPWARPEVVAASAPLRHLRHYLRPSTYIGRGIFYFIIFIAFGSALSRLSRRQDASDEWVIMDRLKRLSGGGLVVLFFVASAAYVDWFMSLEPRWYSTIYGVMLITGDALGALSLATIAASRFRDDRRFAALIERGGFYDLGNMLLTFVLLWIYMSFSQFLLIWSGNILGEIRWYLARSRGGWQVVAVALVVFHFFLPFFILIARNVKRKPGRVAAVAAWILLAHYVNVYWLVAPAFAPGRFGFPPENLLSLFGIGGLWLFLFQRRLAARPVVPERDPRLEKLVAHGA